MLELYIWAEDENEAIATFFDDIGMTKQKALDSRKFYNDDVKLFKMTIEEEENA